MNILDQNIIFFDGVCGLCNRTVQFIIKRDKEFKFRFATLQGAFGQQYLKGNNFNTEKFNTIIYLRKGKLLTRSTAALYILKDLGKGWPILFYLNIWIPWFIRDLGYNLISSIRYKIFGKYDSCMIPGKEDQERFI